MKVDNLFSIKKNFQKNTILSFFYYNLTLIQQKIRLLLISIKIYKKKNISKGKKNYKE